MVFLCAIMMTTATPVLLLIFNRPDRTKEVFEQIKKAQPQKLYVVSDGARNEKPGEILSVMKCRAVVQEIDWNCELKTLFRDVNLGSGLGVLEGINWFFEKEEQGIILEDDCLPNQSFFTYAETLLERYRVNEQIMMVSGNNYLLGLIPVKDSYYFSQIPATWGWATWRRAWKKMNYNMSGYEEKIRHFPEISTIWHHHWESILNGKGVQDAWDFQWYFSIYEHNGICIHPSVNLVKNTGFDAKNATHTFRAPWWYKFVIHKELDNIVHPQKIIVSEKADNFLKMRYSYKMPTLIQRIRLKIRQIIQNIKTELIYL